MKEEITICPVDRNNLNKVVKLAVNPGDERFVAPNMYSIAEAYVEPNTRAMAICLNETPIGFLLYGQFQEDDGDFWVGRLMIDKDHRRKGYGKRGMQLAIDDMMRSGAREIYVSLVPGNDLARKLYHDLGFEETGRIEEGEDVLLLEFE